MLHLGGTWRDSLFPRSNIEPAQGFLEDNAPFHHPCADIMFVVGRVSFSHKSGATHSCFIVLLLKEVALTVLHIAKTSEFVFC